MYWYQKQLRMLQTVLREIDIINYDANAVVEYMKKSNSNVLVVNAGGIVDFFHNDIELPHHNPFMLDTQEILADICDECHKNGFHVITRIDFRGAQKYRYESNPDWFAANADGSPKVDDEGLYRPCYLSEYANGHAARFIKNLMTKFPIDGIWENAVAFGHDACYCKACRTSYKADTGKEIPLEENFDSAVFDEYRAWKSEKADAHIRLIRDTVKEFGGDKAYSAEVFGMYHAGGSFHTGIDTYAVKHFDYIVGVGFLSGAGITPGVPPYDTLSYAASAVRFLKAIDAHKTTVLLTGNNGTRWRLVKDPSQETRIWMWEAVSAGANFWNCHFNGSYPAATVDKRNAYIETDIFTYLKDNEAIIQGQTPVTDVGIYFSKTTRDRFSADGGRLDQYGVGIKGIEAVLIDNHIPYGFVTDNQFCLDSIKGLKVLCIPNGACMSDEHMEVIKQYVKNGGSIMASYETSLYNERGIRREDFGLKELFGLSYTGIKKDTSFDCYQMIREPEHEILSGMDADKTEYLMNGSKTLLTRATDVAGKMICSYIPIIPNQYPESAWIKITETQYPTVYCRNYGKGRVVYFSNYIEELVHTNGHEDYFNIVANSLKWLSGQGWQLETTASDSIHAGFTQHIDDVGNYILSFVNVTSSGRRTIRQLVNAPEFEVTLRLEASEFVDFKELYPSDSGKVALENKGLENGKLVLKLNFPSFKEFIAVHIRARINDAHNLPFTCVNK